MWITTPLAVLSFSVFLASAQIALPNPQFLPPNASAGAQATTGGFPNSQWTSLLGSLLYFYDEQRSGVLPSSNRVPWRNDSLIYEGWNNGIDLSGIRKQAQ
jgi:endoglucanase